jgi:hypothetical protein
VKENRATAALSGVEAKNCPSFETLSRFVDGGLDGAPAREMAAHLESCDACFRAITEAAASDLLIPPSLPQSPATPCPFNVSASEEHFAHLAECARCRAQLRPGVRIHRIASWAAAALLLVGLGYGLLRPSEALLIPVDVDAQLSRRPDRSLTRVAVAVGDVGLDSSSSPLLHRAVANGSLRSGDRVTTREGQRVKLNLEGGGELLVNENSRLRLDPAGVRLEEGELVALSAEPLVIVTSSGTAALRSGELHVVSRADLTSVSLLSGGGEFRGADPAIVLAPDQELRFRGKAVSRGRRDEKRCEWAEPIRNVYYVDQFESAELSPFWRFSGAASRVDRDGRSVLSLNTPPRSRKHGAFVGTTGDFPVDGGIAFEIDLRVPRSTAGGRIVALLQSKENGIAWSLSPGEESLEAHPDGRGHHARLWSGRKGDTEGRWQRVKIIVTPQDVALHRDGVQIARKAHGLSGLDRVSLVLGTQASGRSREAVECQVGRVSVQRETLQ